MTNFFVNKTILLAKKIILTNYISNLQGNQDIKDFSYITSDNKNNMIESRKNNDKVEKQKKNLENNNKIYNQMQYYVISSTQ